MRSLKALFSAGAIATVLMSAAWSTAEAQEVRVFGTIRTPDNQRPMDGSIDILLINPDEDRISAYPDAEGNWEANVPQGIWTITLRGGLSEQYWRSEYAGGAMFPWEAEWFYADAADVGPFNLVTRPGGRIEGHITDPDGNPVGLAEVAVYVNDKEIIYLGLSESTDDSGHFMFYGVPEGPFKLAVDPGFHLNDEHQPLVWPFMFAGGGFDVRTAHEYTMTAGQDMEINVQLTKGGLVEIHPKDPNGGIYSVQEDNAVVFPFLLDGDGDIMYNVSESSPFESAAVYAIVPPGRYTLAGMPLYALFVEGVNPPSIRRTFLGGGYTQEGAQYFDIAADQTVTLDLNMVESGHGISGQVRAENGDPVSTFVSVVDGSGLPVGSGFDPSGAGNYVVKGLDDGEYHLLADLSDLTYLVSTWYPNFADPEAVLSQAPPQGAGTVRIAGGDVEHADIIAQTVDGFELSAPKEDKGAAATEFKLYEAYPNPFNARSNIVFNMAAAANAKVGLYGVDGRLITTLAEGRFGAGLHHVAINAEGLTAGTYLVRLDAGGQSATKQIVLVK